MSQDGNEKRDRNIMPCIKMEMRNETGILCHVSRWKWETRQEYYAMYQDGNEKRDWNIMPCIKMEMRNETGILCHVSRWKWETRLEYYAMYQDGNEKWDRNIMPCLKMEIKPISLTLKFIFYLSFILKLKPESQKKMYTYKHDWPKLSHYRDILISRTNSSVILPIENI